MNTKDLPETGIVKRMKLPNTVLSNTVQKQITTLAGIRRDLLIGKAG